MRRPYPLDLPTPKEFEQAEEGLSGLKQLCSPVFFSTREDGTIEQGLHNLPVQRGEAVLLVGNHQTVPLDTGFHISEV
jgi:hypothetical protein